MAKIVIKKRVELGFLGEEYEKDYLEFSSLPLSEYEKLLDQLEGVQEDNRKSLQLIKDILESRFLSGKFQDEEVVKEDLQQFDLETLTRCFELFTGRRTDENLEKA